MSVFLSGCNPLLSMKNAAGDLKEKISSEIAESQKRLDSRLNKKISTLNTAISEKDEEIIYDLMADDLKEHGDKLRIQLKEFVNYVPGEIVNTSNRTGEH